ncbi:MAG: tetratricopeptide repeat protein [Chitinophagales bacterium]
MDSLQLLINQYEKDNSENELVEIHYQIGDHYFYEKSYEKAINSYKISLKIAEETSNQKMVANNLYRIGVMHNYLQNSPSALEHLLKANKIMQELKSPDPKQLGKTLNYIAKIYQKVGNFELAYDYQLRALQIFEELKDSSRIAGAHYGLGNIFFYQDQYPTAIKHYQESKYIASQINLTPLVIATIGSIGSAYDRLDKVDESLKYNLLCLKTAEENKFESQQADARHNVASNYHSLGYCYEALDYYKQSLDYKRKSNDGFGEVGTLRAISSVYLDLGMRPTAIRYLKKALKIAEEIDSDTRRMDVYQHIASAYEQNGDHVNAYKYMKSYIELKDLVMNQNTAEVMAKAKTRYEVEKREKKIGFLKKENELLEKNEEISSLRSIALLGLSLGLILILLVSYFYYQNQRRYNKILEDKSKQIEFQNKQLEAVNKQLEEINISQKSFNDVLATKNLQIEQQNKQLEDTNEELKQFAYVASHDLKEPLRMISSYTSLIQRRYTQNLDEGAKEFMGYIVDATHRMNNLLEDLLSYSRISTHNQQRERVNMNEILEGVLANLRLNVQQKGAKIHIEDLPKVKVSRSQMGQLYQNLISNALKFSDQDHPEINITSRKNGKMYIFGVKDNGIGIDPEHQQKIFEMFSRLHTREEYEGTGIGLATCKKIVERHGGSIWVESEKNDGATFYFTLPFDKKLNLSSEASPSFKKMQEK